MAERKIEKQIDRSHRWLVDRVAIQERDQQEREKAMGAMERETNERDWISQIMNPPLRTHPADDVVMVRQVSLASLAPVDLVAIEIGVVREPHGCDNDERRTTNDDDDDDCGCDCSNFFGLFAALL